MQVAGQTRHAGGRPRTRQPSDLYVRVELLAKRRGLRLEDLAEAAGVGLSTLYRLHDPRVSTVKAIADTLGVTIDRLMRTGQPSRETSRSAGLPVRCIRG
jgi:transcriptional regulator with XRE-family HTH domain